MKNLKTFCFKAYVVFFYPWCVILGLRCLNNSQLLFSTRIISSKIFFGGSLYKTGKSGNPNFFKGWVSGGRVGIIPEGQESPQSTEWKATEVSMHFVFSDSWCSGTGSHSGNFNSCTNCSSVFASSILSVVKSIPQIMFVLMFLFSLLNRPYGSPGTNRI